MRPFYTLWEFICIFQLPCAPGPHPHKWRKMTSFIFLHMQAPLQTQHRRQDANRNDLRARAWCNTHSAEVGLIQNYITFRFRWGNAFAVWSGLIQAPAASLSGRQGDYFIQQRRPLSPNGLFIPHIFTAVMYACIYGCSRKWALVPKIIIAQRTKAAATTAIKHFTRFYWA